MSGQILRELENAFAAFVNNPNGSTLIKLAEWMEIYIARSKST